MKKPKDKASLGHLFLAAGIIVLGRVWFMRRGKNRMFNTFTVNRPWQSALAQIMPTIRTKAGFLLVGSATDYTSDWIRVFGNHEVSTERFIHEHARGGSTMLDIGSNIGYFAFYSALVKGTKSIAFEPNPAVIFSLNCSIEINKANGRVQIIQSALGDRDETARIVPDETKADLGCGRIETDPTGSVKVQRLDTLEEQIGPFKNVSVVKIDVEGWELPVLRGMKKFLQRERPALAVEDLSENYSVTGRSQGELEKILGELGYVEDRSYRSFDRFPSNRFFVTAKSQDTKGHR